MTRRSLVCCTLSITGFFAMVALDPSLVRARTSVPAKANPSTATVTIVHPAMGFSVLPGSVRRLYATVTGGVTNGVTWTVSGGGVLS
ncbi:MAG TPA: hypothetical protein VMV57_03775, partial [Terracidiphilus sp.]|nr:hypothetical protein [Terracidiphilus sp.]